MKEQFPWFFPPSEDEFWKEGIFVFDTNALLDLYRYPKENREEFLAVLEKIKSRLWIPSQVAREFLSRRQKSIQEQHHFPKTIVEKLTSALKDFKAKYPAEDWHTANIVKITDEYLAKLPEALKKELGELDFSVGKDTVLNRLQAITKDRVGKEFDPTELNDKLKTAKDRMASRVPPGFRDFPEKIKGYESSKEPNPNNAYGDLLIWLQVIDHCATITPENKRCMIFVTRDQKEDWIQKGERDIDSGPRHELLEELYKKAKGYLRIYKTSEFLQHAKEKLKATVQDRTIEEAKKIEARKPPPSLMTHASLIAGINAARETAFANEANKFSDLRHWLRDTVEVKQSFMPKLSELLKVKSQPTNYDLWARLVEGIAGREIPNIHPQECDALERLLSGMTGNDPLHLEPDDPQAESPEDAKK
jgi:predicted nucleic acid-binding protein